MVNLPQRVCGIKMELLNLPFYLEITLPPVECLCMVNLPQRVCGIKMELLNMPIHLKITLPLWNAYGKSFTGGELYGFKME